jgi:hypothetical protein
MIGVLAKLDDGSLYSDEVVIGGSNNKEQAS